MPLRATHLVGAAQEARPTFTWTETEILAHAFITFVAFRAGLEPGSHKHRGLRIGRPVRISIYHQPQCVKVGY